MDVSYIKQPPGSDCCGQACVAMLAGITLDESIAMFGKKGGTTTKDVVAVLTRLGIGCADRLVRKKPAGTCIVSVLAKSDKTYRHWVLYHNGVYFDPACGIMIGLNNIAAVPGDGWYECEIERHEASYLEVMV